FRGCLSGSTRRRATIRASSGLAPRVRAMARCGCWMKILVRSLSNGIGKNKDRRACLIGSLRRDFSGITLPVMLIDLDIRMVMRLVTEMTAEVSPLRRNGHLLK